MLVYLKPVLPSSSLIVRYDAGTQRPFRKDFTSTSSAGARCKEKKGRSEGAALTPLEKALTTRSKFVPSKNIRLPQVICPRCSRHMVRIPKIPKIEIDDGKETRYINVNILSMECI